jgi:NTP pyrophosphatase (non-canonical NTP hydrolase)
MSQLNQVNENVIKKEFHELEAVIPYHDFVKTTFAWTTEVNLMTAAYALDLSHLGIGLAGEYIEFNNELNNHKLAKILSSSEESERTYKKAQKELGDMCYYTQMLANLVNINLNRINTIDVENNPTAIEDMLDGIKRKLFYKHELNLQPFVCKVWLQLNYIALDVFNLPIEFFLVQNKKKLQARYPTGSFSSTDAAIKADEKA